MASYTAAALLIVQARVLAVASDDKEKSVVPADHPAYPADAAATHRLLSASSDDISSSYNYRFGKDHPFTPGNAQCLT